MMSENESRKFEEEKTGRRQAENILHIRLDIMAIELKEVNQVSKDSYINSLFTNNVNKVINILVNKKIEFKAFIE